MSVLYTYHMYTTLTCTEQLALKELRGKSFVAHVMHICSEDDCGQCTNCRDMIKFGSTGTKKKCCVHLPTQWSLFSMHLQGHVQLLTTYLWWRCA